MSSASYDQGRQLTVHDVDLHDTDLPVSGATDHLGRKVTTSKREAFRQDLPYIIGLVLLVTYIFFALGGYFRL